METREVAAGKDTLLSLAKNASTVTAVAELLWNAIDADAFNIDVEVPLNAMGNAESLTVTDNGHGMTRQFAESVFLVHGESWKATSRVSKSLQRPLHGQMGRGRFTAFALASRVRWRTVCQNGEQREATLIEGERSNVNRFGFDGPLGTQDSVGTAVNSQLSQDPKVTRLHSDGFALELTSQLAPTLLSRNDVTVTYRGKKIDPASYISNSEALSVDVEGDLLRGHPTPTLMFIEWTRNMEGKRKKRLLHLCDEHGTAVSNFELSSTPPTPVHWSAYLRWEGFRDPDLMTSTDQAFPDFKHSNMLAAAQRALVLHLNERLDQQRGALIEEWKTQGVYPYKSPPATAAEEIERDLFDVVAVVASAGIGKERSQKRLSLHLLQESMQSAPRALPKILDAVLNLSEEEQETLSELLERTQLAAIIKTARTVADRADFLRGLNALLYSDESRTQFREVDQLHPMVVQEPWIFGDEWNLTLSESGLNGVVASVVEASVDTEYAPDPVLREDGRRGRVDLVFYRFLTESERDRHLVVELKRPMRLTHTEFGQVSSYADAITEHSQVSTTASMWDFWLIGTEMNRTLGKQAASGSEPGLLASTPKYRIHVVTWAQLIQRGERRIEAFRKQLDIISTHQTSRQYLQQVHQNFIPDAPTAESSD